MKYYTKARLEAWAALWVRINEGIRRGESQEENRRRAGAWMKAWDEAYRRDRAQAGLPQQFAFQYTTMHDCLIRRVHWAGQNLTMDFDIDGGLTDVFRLTFVEAQVKAFRFRPPMDWQFTELYFEEGWYDIQFLTQHSFTAYQENRILAKDVWMERDPLYVQRQVERYKRRRKELEKLRRRYAEWAGGGEDQGKARPPEG